MSNLDSQDDDEIRDRVIDEIAARNEISVPPHAFTLHQFVERTGWTDYRARKTLSKEVESGKLNTDFVSENRARKQVWWTVEDEQRRVEIPPRASR